MTAAELLYRARTREEAEAKARIPVDYDALNVMVRRQRAALTRAVNSKDAKKVVAACAKAVNEWNRPGVAWPDDWSRWQRALDDALGMRTVQLDSLADRNPLEHGKDER